jgi:ABC-type multidrug transport system fused ATPase/permease subunit
MATTPEQDQLAQQYRNRVLENTSNLSKSISKASDTYDLAKQIPGVSQETLDTFKTVIDDAKLFYQTVDKETADAIATKRDTLELKTQQFVDTTQSDVKNKEKRELEKKEEEKKLEKENATFNSSRFTSKLWDILKKSAFWIGFFIIALWGGSIASNHAINETLAIRIYYFIFGTLLFPISFLFAFWRWMTGESAKGRYHAFLAPIIQKPTYWWIHVFLCPFTCKAPLQPQAVSFVAAPIPVSDESQLP